MKGMQWTRAAEIGVNETCRQNFEGETFGKRLHRRQRRCEGVRMNLKRRGFQDMDRNDVAHDYVTLSFCSFGT
jgi:hypothetical protein